MGKSMIIADRYTIKPTTLNMDKINDLIIIDSSGAKVKRDGSLLVKMGASHWGFINGNGFYYDPETIDGTLPTWTKPYQKPVLGYHPKVDDEAASPLGRIIQASYVKGVARQYVHNDLIPNNMPHGHLEFLTRIADESAIKKCINGLYDTVSISAIATNVTCSICGENAATGDEEHEHKRFHRYNKKGEVVDDVSKGGLLCYYKAGPLMGRHVAFVITPSDQYAGVKDMEWEQVEDKANEQASMEYFVLSDNDKLFMSLNDDKSDNLYDMIDHGKRSVIIDMINKVDLGVVSNNDGKDGEIMPTDNTKEKKSITIDDLLEMEEADVDALYANTPDLLSDEAKAYMESDDAQLSYKARKGLPDSAFCGPGRSFPAQDAAHVRNGLARLNQSKGKAKGPILACLRSRAKKYGIKVTTKVKDEIETVDSIYDIMLFDAKIDDILALDIVKDYLEANYVKKDPAAVQDGATETKPANGEVNDGADGEKKVEDKQEPTGEVKTEPKPEGATTSEIADEVKTLTAQNAETYKKYKQSIVDRIIDQKLWLRKIKSDDVEKEKSELMAREEQSLNDTLTDLLKESNNGVAAPSEKVESKQVQEDEAKSKDGKIYPKYVDKEARTKELLPWLQ